MLGKSWHEGAILLIPLITSLFEEVNQCHSGNTSPTNRKILQSYQKFIWIDKALRAYLLNRSLNWQWKEFISINLCLSEKTAHWVMLISSITRSPPIYPKANTKSNGCWAQCMGQILVETNSWIPWSSWAEILGTNVQAPSPRTSSLGDCKPTLKITPASSDIVEQ